MTGESLSQFIRTAAGARADAVLTDPLDDDWSDVIGAVRGGGGQARGSGDAFSDLMAQRRGR